MTTIQILTHLKQILTPINDIKTVKIGIEKDLNPTNYPMIRIVPTKSTKGDALGSEITQIDILVGGNLDAFDGLEANYTQLNEWEESIKTILATNDDVATFIWQDTIHDEDKLLAVKLLIMDVLAIS